MISSILDDTASSNTHSMSKRHTRGARAFNELPYSHYNITPEQTDPLDCTESLDCTENQSQTNLKRALSICDSKLGTEESAIRRKRGVEQTRIVTFYLFNNDTDTTKYRVSIKQTNC